MQRFERVAVFLLLVASPIWLSALPASLTGSFRMHATGWLEPPLKVIQILHSGVVHFFVGIVRGPVLLEENRLLRSQLETLQAHEETHRQLFEENVRLRAAMEFEAKSSWPLIPAEVIGREMGLWSRTFLIDKGKRDGLRSGMAVITPLGLVGRIVEVGPGLSRAVWLTDPHFRVSAAISSSRVSGLVMGTSSGECLLTYLPLDTTVHPQETVVTSGGRSFCPEGIPIGQIRSVAQDSSQLFQSARIRSSVDLSAVEEVLVVAWMGEES